MVLPLWKSQKIKNTVIPYDPAILLLSVYLKEFESWVLKDSSTPVVHCSIVHNSQEVEVTQMFMEG